MELSELNDKFTGHCFLVANGPLLLKLTERQIEALQEEVLGL